MLRGTVVLAPHHTFVKYHQTHLKVAHISISDRFRHFPQEIQNLWKTSEIV